VSTLAERQEQLQRLAGDADELVQNLAALRDAVQSYKASSDRLDDVAGKLTELVDRTAAMAARSQELLQVMLEVGAGGMQESLTRIDKNSEAARDLLQQKVVNGISNTYNLTKATAEQIDKLLETASETRQLGETIMGNLEALSEQVTAKARMTHVMVGAGVVLIVALQLLLKFVA